MSHVLPFGEVLEAVEGLSLEEQETLVEIIRRRAAERGRARIVADVQEARREFAEGHSRVATPAEIMDEITS